MKSYSLALGIAGCLAVGNLALAQSPNGDRGPRGRDGGGSPLERMMQLFDRADADQDGNLTKEELKTAIESQTENNRARQRRTGPTTGEGERRTRAGARRGPPPRDGERRGPPPSDGERDGPPPRDGERRGPPTRDGERGGPPPRDAGPDSPRRERSGPGGPPTRPGQILPAYVLDSLDLNDEQRSQLALLQQEVDTRLKGILSAEQQEQMRNRPPRPRGPGRDAGGPSGDRGPNEGRRPQRPARAK